MLLAGALLAGGVQQAKGYVCLLPVVLFVGVAVAFQGKKPVVTSPLVVVVNQIQPAHVHEKLMKKTKIEVNSNYSSYQTGL
ncbi:hypothetical protein T4E_8409 [Trichinella pseudospiralis]|nr:hypothetical protein T4E_8409 [Trichinella pseudospiralis]